MNPNTEATQKMRARRLADGLCQCCGKEPFMRGRKACRACLTEQARYQSARRAARMVAA